MSVFNTGFLKSVSDWVKGESSNKPIITINGNVNALSGRVDIPASSDADPTYTSGIIEVLNDYVNIDIRWREWEISTAPDVHIQYVDENGYYIHEDDTLIFPRKKTLEGYQTWSFNAKLRYRRFRVKIVNNQDSVLTLSAIHVSSEAQVKIRGGSSNVLSDYRLDANQTIATPIVELSSNSFDIMVDTTHNQRTHLSIDLEYLTENGQLIDKITDIDTFTKSIDGRWKRFIHISEGKSKFVRLTLNSQVASDRDIKAIQFISLDHQPDDIDTFYIEPEDSITTRDFLLKGNSHKFKILVNNSVDASEHTVDLIYSNYGNQALTTKPSVFFKTESVAGATVWTVECIDPPTTRVRVRINNNSSSASHFYGLTISPNPKKSYENPVAKFPASTLRVETPTEDDIQISDVGESYVYGFKGTTVYRSADALDTVETGFDISTVETGWTIRGFFKTHHGYCIVTDDLTAKTGAIWFSTSWDTGYAKVKLYDDGVTDYYESPSAFGELAMHFKNQSILNDVCMVGEYSADGRRVYLSKDGGETWDMVLETTTIDAGTNHHCHVVLYDDRRGLCWAIWGDTVNSSIHFSDDLGVTWEKFKPDNARYEDVNRLQSTIMIPTDYGYLLAPDWNVAPGLYALREVQIDKDNIYTADASGSVRYNLSLNLTREYEIHNANTPAGKYYPVHTFNHNGVIYILFSTDLNDGTQNKVCIVASGDGGETFHQIFVYEPETSAQFKTGIYGIDKDGYVYFQAVVNSSTKTVRAKAIEWRE